jgi:hypothetical protein
MTMTVEVYYQDQWLKSSKHIDTTAASIITTAGAETYTAAQCLGGVILRDPNGAGRTDVLPTAALLLGPMRAPRIGDTIYVLVINTADAAETITISAGAGGSFDAAQIAATRIIPQNTSRTLLIRITGVGASPSYVVYM